MNRTAPTPGISPWMPTTQHTLAALATTAGTLVAALIVAREPLTLRCELALVIISAAVLGVLVRRLSAVFLGVVTSVVCAGLTIATWGPAVPVVAAERTAWLVLLTMSIVVVAVGAQRLLTSTTEVPVADVVTAPLPAVAAPTWCATPDTSEADLAPGQRRVWLVDRALTSVSVGPDATPATRVMPRVVIARTSDGFTAAPVPTCSAPTPHVVTDAEPRPTIDITDLPILVGHRTGTPQRGPRRNPFVQAAGGIDAAGPDRTDLGTLRSERPAGPAPRDPLAPPPTLVPLSSGRVTLELEFDRARLTQGSLAVLVLSTAGVPGARPLPYRVDETGPWGQAALSDRTVHDLVPPAVLGAIVQAVTSTIDPSQTAFVITPDELGIVVPGLSVEDGWDLRERLMTAINAAIAELGLGLASEDDARVRSSMVFADDDTPSAKDLLQDARRALHYDWDADWLA